MTPNRIFAAGASPLRPNDASLPRCHRAISRRHWLE